MFINTGKFFEDIVNTTISHRRINHFEIMREYYENPTIVIGLIKSLIVKEAEKGHSSLTITESNFIHFMQEKEQLKLSEDSSEPILSMMKVIKPQEYHNYIFQDIIGCIKIQGFTVSPIDFYLDESGNKIEAYFDIYWNIYPQQLEFEK